jgi:Cu(I)/Ag(I) efflux system protein CusF
MIKHAIALAAAFVIAAPVLAQHSGHSSAGDAKAASTALSEGEVRKVDRDARKLTIKHGPIANLDMPPMTMVFGVKDAAALDNLRTGDRIRFRAEMDGSNYVVTRIEK